jgi:hypothetical protein
MNLRTLVVFGIAAACVFAGCAKGPHSPVVARVGKSVLTLDQLYQNIPPEYSDYITREQLVKYVRQWIDNKILYAEALRLKIDKEETIRERLRRMKEDLLCAEMVSRCTAATQPAAVSEEDIEAYYNENKAKFIREQDAAKYLCIACADMNTAAKVRGMATGDNFSSLAAHYSQVPVPDEKKAQYVKFGDVPAELAREIVATKIGGITPVVRTGAGFCVARVLDKQPRGAPCPLPEVRDDIAGLLATRMQNAAVERLIASLRARMAVEVNLDAIRERRPLAQEGVQKKSSPVPFDSLSTESEE